MTGYFTLLSPLAHPNMYLPFFVGVLGLLSGRSCEAFLPAPALKRYRTDVASSNYLDNLSSANPSSPSPPPPVAPAPPTLAPGVPQVSFASSPAEQVAATPPAAGDSETAIAPFADEEAPASTDLFQYVPVLSMYQADAISDKVIEACKRNGFNPITVFVLDASGSPLVSKRMDGCSPVGVANFAKAKAYSCIVNKYPSRAFRDRYTSEEASAKFSQMTSMVAVSGNQMAPFPGGILLKVGDTIVGAVGVSGAAGDEDEYCAIRGVLEANLGISTVPESHALANPIDGQIEANPTFTHGGSNQPAALPPPPAEMEESKKRVPGTRALGPFILPHGKTPLSKMVPGWADEKTIGPW